MNSYLFGFGVHLAFWKILKEGKNPFNIEDRVRTDAHLIAEADGNSKPPEHYYSIAEQYFTALMFDRLSHREGVSCYRYAKKQNNDWIRVLESHHPLSHLESSSLDEKYADLILEKYLESENERSLRSVT